MKAFTALFLVSLLGATSADLTNFLNIGGKRYATLDDVAASNTTKSCQSDFLELPTGWSIADDDDATNAAIASGTWGTYCLVVANGNSYMTGNSFECGLNQLEIDNGKLKPKGCPRRILVSQDGQTSDTDVANATITKTLTFNGIEFATLDDGTPASAIGIECQQYAMKLPEGWSLAEDNEVTRGAIAHDSSSQFGTECVLLANGIGIKTSDATNCSVDVDLIEIGNHEKFYHVRQCPRRVLIRKDGEDPIADLDLSNTNPACKENTKPTAVAGPDQSFDGLQTAFVDGSNSTDVEVANTTNTAQTFLTYKWTFAATPLISRLVNADISDSEEAIASFIPDVKGSYTLQLEVGDNCSTTTTTTTVSFSQCNKWCEEAKPVVANAGGHTVAYVNDFADLVAEVNNRFDQTYSWQLISKPEKSYISNANIGEPNSPKTNIYVDWPGTYLVRLEVADECSTAVDVLAIEVTAGVFQRICREDEGDCSYDFIPETLPRREDGTFVTYEHHPCMQDEPPVASAGDDVTVGVYEIVTLDASATTDKEDDGAIYRWSVFAAPAGSDIPTIPGPKSKITTFQPTATGKYEILLEVWDRCWIGATLLNVYVEACDKGCYVSSGQTWLAREDRDFYIESHTIPSEFNWVDYSTANNDTVFFLGDINDVDDSELTGLVSVDSAKFEHSRIEFDILLRDAGFTVHSIELMDDSGDSVRVRVAAPVGGWTTEKNHAVTKLSDSNTVYSTVNATSPSMFSNVTSVRLWRTGGSEVDESSQGPVIVSNLRVITDVTSDVDVIADPLKVSVTDDLSSTCDSTDSADASKAPVLKTLTAADLDTTDLSSLKESDLTLGQAFIRLDVVVSATELVPTRLELSDAIAVPITPPDSGWQEGANTIFIGLNDASYVSNQTDWTAVTSGVIRRSGPCYLTDDQLDLEATVEVSIRLEKHYCSSGNEPPTANAGENVVGEVFTFVYVDGSKSSDPETDSEDLFYHWGIVSTPKDSSLGRTDLFGRQIQTASFRPDVPGDYIFQLDVSDNCYTDSTTVTVTVKSTAELNDEPIPDAGEDQEVEGLFQWITIDGTNSTDPDGDDLWLGFYWTFDDVPSRSRLTDDDIYAADSMALRGGGRRMSVDYGYEHNQFSPKVMFKPDAYGVYSLTMEVCDGYHTVKDTVEVRVAMLGQHCLTDKTPIAQANLATSTVNVGHVVDLDGTNSSDPENAELKYRWRFVSVPKDSKLEDRHLRSRFASVPSFIPDAEGEYKVELEVTDACASSRDEILIQATCNRPPVVNAGDDQTVTRDVDHVTLDGSGSFDPEGDRVVFEWSFVSVPERSRLGDRHIRSPNKLFAFFTPDAVGTYIVKLTASGDKCSTGEDEVEVEVTEMAPIRNAPPAGHPVNPVYEQPEPEPLDVVWCYEEDDCAQQQENVVYVYDEPQPQPQPQEPAVPYDDMDCCSVHNGPFCRIEDVNLHVCKKDPYCCQSDSRWDEYCVGHAFDMGYCSNDFRLAAADSHHGLRSSTTARASRPASTTNGAAKGDLVSLIAKASVSILAVGIIVAAVVSVYRRRRTESESSSSQQISL